MKYGLLILAALCAYACIAKDEFGDLASAKLAHPEFFKPGSVLEASLNGTTWYVYCGDAERCFKDETEEELYQEAEVQAKALFWEFFAKADKSTKVSVSGSRRMYQIADGAMRYVVMGVPKENVIVTKSPVMVAPAASQSVDNANPAESAPIAVKSENCPVNCIRQNQQDEKSVERKLTEPKIADAEESGALEDNEKLTVLRARLEKNPQDFHCRIRMARIFANQGKTSRALNNYVDAVHLMALDDCVDEEVSADVLREVAEFEEQNGSNAMALKHYRALQKSGISEHVAFATDRISKLLLHCR